MKRKLVPILAAFLLLAGLSSCFRNAAGCPGVKSYTNSSFKKSNAEGLAPWSKKASKKDKKKASSGNFGKGTKE